MGKSKKTKVSKSVFATGIEIKKTIYVTDNTSNKDEIQYVIYEGMCNEGEYFKLQRLYSGLEPETALQIIDDGNGYVFSEAPMNSKSEYLAAHEMYIMLIYLDKQNRFDLKIKFFAEI